VLFCEYKWWLADQLTKCIRRSADCTTPGHFHLIKENPYLMLALLCIS
jgi:hypothetical protein